MFITFAVLLGIIGLLYHAEKDLKSFMFNGSIPFTGFALKIYLNERPLNLERGLCLSWLVLRICNGLIGVYALYDILRKYLAPKSQDL
jgi:hypothetical protein